VKAKVKSRVFANRNLSLGVLHEEQLNHLPFTCQFQKDFAKQSRHKNSSHLYADDQHYQGYLFLHPSKSETQTSDLEIVHLATFYAAEFECSRLEITSDPNFSSEIVKWARCQLKDDRDIISSSWHEARRSMVPSSRQSSTVRYSLFIHDNARRGGGQSQFGRHICYGTVLYFFVHSCRQQTRMLAYVQQYKSTDHSSRMPDVRLGKVVQFDGGGRKEVLCVTSLDTGIGMMTSRGRRYFINRNSVLYNPDEND
jgi:hypothetical protein